MNDGRGMSPGHRCLKTVVSFGHRRFARSFKKLEAVQRGKLNKLMGQVASTGAGRRHGLSAGMGWEAFARQVPVTDYEYWRADIAEQRRDNEARLTRSPVQRYQPTSGSSAAVKWIPYTRQFLGELDAAITPWISDLYRQWPGMGRGRHYWSMSWVPTELRQQINGDVNDDMKLMSPIKRALAGATQAVPQGVSLADTSDDSMFATLACLAARQDLAMISVWSPTFGIGLMEAMSRWREPLAEALEQGNWGDAHARMAGLVCPRSRRAAATLRHWRGDMDPAFFAALWPHLKLVSAWDTAASAPWAKKLQALLPHADFQGKGLWATEGVVTFPYGDRFPLAYQSHVYEFEDVQDGRIIPPWALRRGQEVMPLISTGSGLLRYRMNDVTRVDDFIASVPCLRFLGRNDGTDMVGEKLSVAIVQEILDELDFGGTVRPVSLVALDDAGSGKPGYVLLLEPDNDVPDAARQERLQALSQSLEHRLLRQFHYRLARDLGQLSPVRCVCHDRMRDIYLDKCRAQGMVEGNIKVEALRHWGERIPAALQPLVHGAAPRGTHALAEAM
jgi:hypothetical protein